MHGFSGDAPPHTSSLPPFGRSNSAAATVEYPSPFSGKTSCMGVSVIRVVIHPNTLGMGSGFHFYILPVSVLPSLKDVYFINRESNENILTRKSKNLKWPLPIAYGSLCTNMSPSWARWIENCWSRIHPVHITGTARKTQPHLGHMGSTDHAQREYVGNISPYSYL